MGSVIHLNKSLLILCFLLHMLNANNVSDVNSENLTSAHSKGNEQHYNDGLSRLQKSDFSSISNPDIQEISSSIIPKREKMKPFRSLEMKVYKNYRSTYVGNQTALEYVRNVNKPSSANLPAHQAKSTESISETKLRKKHTSTSRTSNMTISGKTRIKKRKKKIAPANPNGELRYNVGPGVNVSLDMKDDIVNVNLDEDCLMEIFTGRWDDNSDEGRGKKYNMISKILPLFILPFLIQSAIIPFFVTKLKLMLVKSIVVGKVAIFLLILSAFKNHQKLGAYEAPAYYVDPPSRRSEQYSGYRVEGRPTTFVN